MMKRTTLITSLLVCFGIGFAAYYRLYLMPPAIQYMKDRQLERPSEYRPLTAKKGADTLPTFRLEDINGVVFDSYDLRGKIVFLNFWTTWCTTCVSEMPAMENLHQKLKNKDVIIVAINIKESLTQVKNFVGNNRLTFTTLLDSDGEITKSFNVFAVPTTFIYGKSGQLLDTVIGFRRWDSKSSISKIKRMIDNE